MGLGTAGFAHSHHQGGFQRFTELSQHHAHAVRIDIVEEVKRQALATVLKGLDHQFRPQTTATDADPQHIGEGLSTRCSGCPRTRSLPNCPTDRFPGRCAHEPTPKERAGGPQPVVADLPVLIGVGDGSGFEILHRSKCLLEPGLQRLKVRC